MRMRMAMSKIGLGLAVLAAVAVAANQSGQVNVDENINVGQIALALAFVISAAWIVKSRIVADALQAKEVAEAKARDAENEATQLRTEVSDLKRTVDRMQDKITLLERNDMSAVLHSLESHGKVLVGVESALELLVQNLVRTADRGSSRTRKTDHQP